MALLPPTKIRPFSVEFAELISNMLTEISRLSEIADDVQRVRALAPDPPEPAGGDIVLFTISSPFNWQDPSGDSMSPVLYNGTIKEYTSGSVQTPYTDPPEPTEEEEDAFGWDMNRWQNKPLISPFPNGLTMDPLGPTTVVLAKRLNKTTCVFSSVLPRFSVECG
jgi:hypothetical protein